MQYAFSATQFYSLTLAISSALLVSACAVTPTLTPAAYYQCDRGTQLRVVFTEIREAKIINGGRNVRHRIDKRVTSATVTLSDNTKIELPAQRVASGFMVSNGRYTFRGKANEATWAVGRMAEEQCSLKPNGQ